MNPEITSISPAPGPHGHRVAPQHIAHAHVPQDTDVASLVNVHTAAQQLERVDRRGLKLRRQQRRR